MSQELKKAVNVLKKRLAQARHVFMKKITKRGAKALDDVATGERVATKFK